MTVETVAQPHRKVSVLLIIGIVIFPAIFAWFTLRQGYSTLARAVSFGWMILALAIIFASHPGNPGASAPSISEAASSSAPAAAAEDPRYKNMSLNDWKLDKAQLVGQRVRVRGLYQAMGDLSILASELMDTSPAGLDISRLSRDERRELQGCDGRTCTFMIEGIVQQQPLGVGITAERAVKE